MKKTTLISMIASAVLFAALGATTASAEDSKCGASKKEMAKKCGAEKKEMKKAAKKCGAEKKEMKKAAKKCGTGKCGDSK